jgi:hypothetical protein
VDLNDESIESYVALVNPTDLAEERAARAARLRARVAAGQLDLANIRVVRDAGGEVIAAVRLDTISPAHLYWGSPAMRSEALHDERQETALLVRDALGRTRSLGASMVSTRILDEPRFEAYERALAEAGFAQTGDRVEFESAVRDLPEEGQSPLAWRPLGEVPKAAVVKLLVDVSVGDPCASEADDADAELSGWLQMPGTTRVDIGVCEGQMAAAVVAYARPETGWSTILYMGVIPSLRGRGLGAFVHRHGFAMLRALGGATYHGGTSARNGAMLHLFEVHGCRECARFKEWHWTAQ